MKKIAVWAGWGRNFGDLLLLDQQVKLLRQQCQEELLIVPLSSHGVNGQSPLITAETVDYINSCDMLIIGSGGQLLPDRARYGHWQFNIPIQMIDDIKVPIVVYGIGSNTFAYPGDGGPLNSDEQRTFETHLARVCSRAQLCSVRDSIALDLIKNKLGVTDTALIGDPALLLKHPTYPSGVVGLVLGGDRITERYGSRREYLDVLVDLTSQLKQFVLESEFIGQIKLIPHSSLYDVEYVYILEQLLQADEFSFIFEHRLLPESVDKLLHLRRAYLECDYIISSRWHGNIIASALGIPNITIGSMLKQQALSADLGIVNWNKGDDLNQSLKQSAEDFDVVANRVWQLQTRTREFSQAVVDLLCH